MNQEGRTKPVSHRADYNAFNTVVPAYCDVKSAQQACWTGYNNLDFTADCESCFAQALKSATDLAMFYAVFVTGDVREAEAPKEQIDRIRLYVGTVLRVRKVDDVYYGIIRRAEVERNRKDKEEVKL